MQVIRIKKFKAGQQIYWILDNDGNLEYLNWLVSEREERIYERELMKLSLNVKFGKKVFERRGSKRTDRRIILCQFESFGFTVQTNCSLTTVPVAGKFNKEKRGLNVLVSREYLDNKLTGQGKVEAILLCPVGKSTCNPSK